MNILYWIILGLASGWIASIVMKTNREQGMFMDVLLGVVGALVGGFLMTFFGFAGITGFDLYSLFVAVLGAVLLISVGKAF